jgi:hypothetical protein
MFCHTLPCYEKKYEEEEKRNKNGENCRLVVKIN